MEHRHSVGHDRRGDPAGKPPAAEDPPGAAEPDACGCAGGLPAADPEIHGPYLVNNLQVKN